MALSAEQKIFTVGVITLVGWLWYSRRRERMERERASKMQAAPTPTEDVTGYPTAPRANIQRDYKIVMPSDMIAPNVRQKAAMLTARRFSVDPSQLSKEPSLSFSGAETFMNKSGGGSKVAAKESWKRYVMSHLEQAGGGLGNITDANRSQKNRVFANLNQLAKDVKRL